VDLPNIVRVFKSIKMRWAGHVVLSAYRVLVRKPKGKRLLGIPQRKWKDNDKLHLQEVVYGGMDWIDRAQNRGSWRALVNVVMKFRVHKTRGIS
jgi:hypothetical protein